MKLCSKLFPSAKNHRRWAARSVHRLLCLAAATILAISSTADAVAEQYLSIEEAQKVCFPDATGFDAQILRFTPEQKKSLEEKTGLKVRNRGNRLWLALQDGKVAGVLFFDQVLGKHELIDYVVALSPEGKVQAVEITEYRESHGTEVRSAKWRGQFTGKAPSDRLRFQTDVYNISGATISCRNVTEGIQRVLATFELVLRPQLVAAGRLPDTVESKPKD